MSDPRSTEAPVLSVVVPLFNEEEGLPELHRRLSEMLRRIDGGGEIVYVDDGSSDRSVEQITGWVRAGEVDVSLVKLSRNFGMEVAMSAGLDYARGQYVGLMHADLQDPPELMPEMLAAVLAGADVAYARRIGRDESAVKRLLATMFYGLMRRVSRVPYQGQASDGILGRYLPRVHAEVLGRPLYLVDWVQRPDSAPKLAREDEPRDVSTVS